MATPMMKVEYATEDGVHILFSTKYKEYSNLTLLNVETEEVTHIATIPSYLGRKMIQTYIKLTKALTTEQPT